MKILNLENETGAIPSFVGQKDLLILGDGAVVIEKSIDRGANFYPMTDSSGDVVILEPDDGVIYNAKIENTNGIVQYRVKLVDNGSASYEVV